MIKVKAFFKAFYNVFKDSLVEVFKDKIEDKIADFVEFALKIVAEMFGGLVVKIIRVFYNSVKLALTIYKAATETASGTKSELWGKALGLTIHIILILVDVHKKKRKMK